MVSTPSRSRQATKISLPFIAGPTSARFRVEVAFAVSIVLLITVLDYDRPSAGFQQKTHDRGRPWVFCRNSVQLRQAPAAPPVTTTTASTTCRTFTIMAKKVAIPLPLVKR